MNDPVEFRSPSSSVGDYLKAIWELAVDSGEVLTVMMWEGLVAAVVAVEDTMEVAVDLAE